MSSEWVHLDVGIFDNEKVHNAADILDEDPALVALSFIALLVWARRTMSRKDLMSQRPRTLAQTLKWRGKASATDLIEAMQEVGFLTTEPPVIVAHFGDDHVKLLALDRQRRLRERRQRDKALQKEERQGQKRTPNERDSSSPQRDAPLHERDKASLEETRGEKSREDSALEDQALRRAGAREASGEGSDNGSGSQAADLREKKDPFDVVARRCLQIAGPATAEDIQDLVAAEVERLKTAIAGTLKPAAYQARCLYNYEPPEAVIADLQLRRDRARSRRYGGREMTGEPTKLQPGQAIPTPDPYCRRCRGPTTVTSGHRYQTKSEELKRPQRGRVQPQRARLTALRPSEVSMPSAW
jgi:hypothetical protein